MSQSDAATEAVLQAIRDTFGEPWETTARVAAEAAIKASPGPSERSLELAEIALEAAAEACQSGASLRGSRVVDPLAREYLIAAREVAALRSGRAGIE